MFNFSAIARRLVERSTRNWVYARRLPSAFGCAPIFVTPSAGLKYLFKSMPNIDPPLLRNAFELVRPNDIVWDIGANVGLFAFAAAARAGPNGRIIAFEPDTWLVQILRKSMTVQPLTSAPVSVIPAAVASEVSLRSFTIASRSRASNAMSDYGRSQMGKAYEKQTIVGLSLDWLTVNLPRPNVVKCDVEGAEIEVFSGQTKLLRDIRPVIICEVGQEAIEQMTDILVKEGYALYDGEKPLAPDAKVDRATWNTIAIPQEIQSRYILLSVS